MSDVDLEEGTGDEIVHIDDLPPTKEDDDEGVDHLKSGRVRVVFDGKTYTLRRPRLGEFRRLREAMISVPSELRQPDDTPESIKTRADEAFDAVIVVLRDVFKTLGDRALPDDENDWPAWITAPKFQSDLLIHWRDVPLARGGSTR